MPAAALKRASHTWQTDKWKGNWMILWQWRIYHLLGFYLYTRRKKTGKTGIVVTVAGNLRLEGQAGLSVCILYIFNREGKSNTTIKVTDYLPFVSGGKGSFYFWSWRIVSAPRWSYFLKACQTKMQVNKYQTTEKENVCERPNWKIYEG